MFSQLHGFLGGNLAKIWGKCLIVEVRVQSHRKFWIRHYGDCKFISLYEIAIAQKLMVT